MDNTDNVTAAIAASYGQQNTHIITQIGKAHSATLRLVEDGFVILCVRVTGANPVITVQNNTAARATNGAMKMRRSVNRIHEIVKAARLYDVQVEWIERGN